MGIQCRHDPLFQLVGWLRDLAILSAVVVAIVIIAVALTAATARGFRDRRNNGGLGRSLRHNLSRTVAGLFLCLGVLPVLAVLAWQFTWNMLDVGSHQRSAGLAAWTLPLWQASPGGLGEALDRVLADPRARKERDRNHLLDMLRRVLTAYEHELDRADRIAVEALPARLRALETHRPHGWRETALTDIEAASAWQIHKPDLKAAFERCGTAPCGAGVIHAFTHWCDRLPRQCRSHLASPEARQAIERAEALGVAEHLVMGLRYRARNGPA